MDQCIYERVDEWLGERMDG